MNLQFSVSRLIPDEIIDDIKDFVLFSVYWYQVIKCFFIWNRNKLTQWIKIFTWQCDGYKGIFQEQVDQWVNVTKFQ